MFAIMNAALFGTFKDFQRIYGELKEVEYENYRASKRRLTPDGTLGSHAFQFEYLCSNIRFIA